MCIVCAWYEMDRLTSQEARRALGEQLRTDEITLEHAKELLERLDEDEKEQEDQ